MKKNITFTQLTAAALLSVATLATGPAVLAQSTDKPYTYVEQMPKFNGGETEMLKFLGQNIRYPEDAQQSGLEGLVVLAFVVDTDGSLKDVKVVKSLTSSTDAEAIRVIKLMDGKWQPGKQSGKVVPVQYTLPIRYALKKGEAKAADRQAQFKGGQEALLRTINQNLKMPEEAKKEHLNAKVVLKFTVEKDGSVSNIVLEHTKLKKTVGPGSELDYMDASTFNLQNRSTLAKLVEAAFEAVRATSGRWQPAIKNGEPVATEMYLPVQFLGSKADNSGETMNTPETQETTQKQRSAFKYEEVDVKPQLRNGSLEKHIAKNLRYPATSEFEGDVKVVLVIDRTGKMLAPMASGEDKGITDEIFRVFDLTKGSWSAGEIDGVPVTTVRHMNIRFIKKNGKQLATTNNTTPADVLVTK